MKKFLAILLCMVLLIVPMTITASAQVDSGTLNVAGGEDYLVDVGVGHYAYSTYSVTVPIFIQTYQQAHIYADMSNFDTNYSLKCYVTNADDTGRITLYADDYETTGNAVSTYIYLSETYEMLDGETKLLHKFTSTKGNENPIADYCFEISGCSPVNGEGIVASGNYNGTLSLRFTCDVA